MAEDKKTTKPGAVPEYERRNFRRGIIVFFVALFILGSIAWGGWVLKGRLFQENRYFILRNIEITSSWFNNIEIMHKGVNKGEALKELVKYLGIDRKEVIAFGDNYNDLDMLKFAGVGVVMGNADEAVKEQGDYVTSTNTEDGVAKAIYKFLGI